VWEKVSAPWFRFIYDESSELRDLKRDEHGIVLTEDYALCDAARAAGFKILIHNKLIEHLKTTPLQSVYGEMDKLRAENKALREQALDKHLGEQGNAN